MNHVAHVGIALCTPIPVIQGPEGPRKAMVTIEWHRARDRLMMPTNCNLVGVAVDGMEVGEARNRAVEYCMELPTPPEFLFFLDYDVLPSWDALKKLIARAHWNTDYDIFCGVYCSKANPAEPLIYNDWGHGPFWNWKMGDILTTDQHGICGIHMGLTLIRMSLFEKLKQAGLPWNDSSDPLFCTEQTATIIDGNISTSQGTEDLYFCNKAHNILLKMDEKKILEEQELMPDMPARKPMGLKILVDTSVMAGHIDHATGRIFGLSMDAPGVRDSWVREDNPDYKKPEGEPDKLALDLGAGGRRRHWEGHKTETTDIRKGQGDYCMDTRWLNFKDGRYDLVASSHHLEHIPRWHQDLVWREMFRILKPGGKIEHTLPSVDWAAQMVVNGIVDEHVVNVLYGAQEEHGYERQFNLHYFPYTKGVAKSLAEAAGFINVECQDWRDNEDLKYHLIVKAEKPALVSVTSLVKPEEMSADSPPTDDSDLDIDMPDLPESDDEDAENDDLGIEFSVVPDSHPIDNGNGVEVLVPAEAQGG